MLRKLVADAEFLSTCALRRKVAAQVNYSLPKKTHSGAGPLVCHTEHRWSGTGHAFFYTWRATTVGPFVLSR